MFSEIAPPTPSGIGMYCSLITIEILLESYQSLFVTHAIIFRHRKRIITHAIEKLSADSSNFVALRQL
jgi:hypothetical protein